MKKTTLISLVVFLFLGYSAKAQLPETPQIDYVSSSASGEVTLHWRVTDPSLVDGFIIVRRIYGAAGAIDGTYHDIDTIYNRNTTQYTDVSGVYGSASPSTRSESYRVKSFKLVAGSLVQSPTMSPAHNTICLLKPEISICDKEVSLTWNQYYGWGGQVGGYIVYAKTDGSSVFEQVGTTSADDTTYTHKFDVTATKITYYISALGGSSLFTTRSSDYTVAIVLPKTPVLFNADEATVVGNKYVSAHFTVAASADIESYLLERSSSPTEAGKFIKHFPSDAGTKIYDDLASDIKVPVFYRLNAVSYCGDVVGVSNWAQNMVLSASIEDETAGKTNVSWTKYENWLGLVRRYTVYRQLDDRTPESLGSYGNLTTEIIDDVNALRFDESNGTPNGGKFCYWVEAEEVNNPSNIVGTSRSNTVCVHFPERILLPEAVNPFSAELQDRVFKPEVSFAQNYLFIVYNRWGNIIFSTSSTSEGWDATSRGSEYVLPGTYIYYIEYSDAYGLKHRQKGQVQVVY